jgi:replication-associated recombination protein RarA
MKKLVTQNGHDFYVIASLFQKAIRRGEAELAGYAANELFAGYYSFLWNRILICSAEDIYGYLTQELLALKLVCNEYNKSKPKDKKTKIFVAKAVVLLLQASKNRDADYLACSLMRHDLPELKNKLLLDEEKGTIKLEDCKFDGNFPEYVYDKHTLKGKLLGKTSQEFDKIEGESLNPKQVGLFDDWDWYYGDK